MEQALLFLQLAEVVLLLFTCESYFSGDFKQPCGDGCRAHDADQCPLQAELKLRAIEEPQLCGGVEGEAVEHDQPTGSTVPQGNHPVMARTDEAYEGCPDVCNQAVLSASQQGRIGARDQRPARLL